MSSCICLIQTCSGKCLDVSWSLSEKPHVARTLMWPAH